MQADEMKLVVEINNKHPIELADLAANLAAMSSEYRHSLEINRVKIEAKHIKLYVKEVRSGSIITELVAMAGPQALQFVEYSKTVLDFGRHLKEWREYLLGETDVAPSDVTKNTLKNISEIFEPIAKDSGSQLNIRAINANGDVHLHFHTSSIEANAIQNRCSGMIEEIREPVTGLHKNMTLYLFQARNQIGERVAGDKAIIESIHDAPVRLMFKDEDIKEAMLAEEHPFSKAFVVDVIVGTVKDRPITYTVTRLHEAIDID